MTAIDINRGTTNVLLPAEVSREIWAKTIEQSAFMQLARRIEMPGSGIDIQTITGEPVANWVAETASKPVSTHTFGKKVIRPYKMAVIEPFSDEFVRDKRALYNECLNRLPKSLGKLFDGTIMGNSAPGTGFDALGGCQKVSLIPQGTATVYGQFISVDAAIAQADGIMNGIALAPQGKSIVLGATDGNGHPLFTAGPGSNTVGSILGADVYVNKGVYVAGTAGSAAAIVGIAGDFEDAVWGSVEGIKISKSDQATLTLADSSTISLFQENMVAIRVEIELAFAVKNADEFVLLTGETPAATTTTGA
ncbi:MAG: phage major capsid protein [Eggerthellaceae bacterium]|nr:phage major capsid protein [Eggerthellaceae bacterium]MBQ3342722.1 phage major capsid protein [Kiritimatiellia bacterium]